MNYKGMSLFNDISDRSTRINNRAVTMVNTMEEHSDKGKVSPRGLSLILGYFNEIPILERAAVNETFKQKLTERGLTRG